MKNVSYDLSEQEKSAIREQHSKLFDYKPLISEQTQNDGSFKFPTDVILTDGSLINPAKIKIPKGTLFNWNEKTRQGTIKVGNGVVTISQDGNAEGTADSTALVFKSNGKNFYMQWADSIFGIVYNKQYQDLAETLYTIMFGIE